MAKMMNPEVEVVRFENEDVISASVRVYRYSNTWFVVTPRGTQPFDNNASGAAQAIVNYYSPNGQTTDANMNALVQSLTDMVESTNGGNDAREAYYVSTNDDGFQYGIQSY